MSDTHLQRLAGSIVMAGFRGLYAEPGTLTHRQIGELGLGGVILFDVEASTETQGRNIAGPPQVAELCAQLQDAAAGSLLIAVDQEGGRVARLNPTNGYPQFPSAEALGRKSDGNETWLAASRISSALADAGFNMNLAPVVDVNVNPDCPIIGARGRSFSDDPRDVCAHARVFIQIHRQKNICCALKHFPGHGSSNEDSHTGPVDITQTHRDRELEPYRTLIDENRVDVVMIGHLRHREYDSEWPASFSKNIMTGLLREQLGFDGVIMTDDLDMEAAAVLPMKERVARALNAGADLLLFGNNLDYAPAKPQEVVDAVCEAVRTQMVPEHRFKQHVLRVDRLRQRLTGKSIQA